MRKWLARLSFSFLIVAAVFAYEGYHTHHGNRPGRPEWAAYVFIVSAALCFGLGLLGVRERHRRQEEIGGEERDENGGGGRDA